MAVEIQYPNYKPFFNLTADDQPSKNDLVIAAQNYIGAFSTWVNPEPEDQTEFGGAVHHLGMVAARKGHPQLFEESLAIAPAYGDETFGYPCHLCTLESAIGYLSKIIEAENLVVVRLAEETIEVCDGVPMRQGFAHSLFWERKARIQLGPHASIKQVHQWCLSRRDQFPHWMLMKKEETFRKYSSEAKRLINEARENRALSVLPAERPEARVRDED